MLLLLLLSLTVVLFSALSSMSEAAFLSISEVDVEKAYKEYGENSAATELKSHCMPVSLIQYLYWSFLIILLILQVL